MITGFNTDIEHDGVVYHVQTEDKGLETPLILSLVYSGGAILASKRARYEDLIATGYSDEALSERLTRQHRLICAAIHAGRIDDLKRMSGAPATVPVSVPTPEIPPSEPEETEPELEILRGDEEREALEAERSASDAERERQAALEAEAADEEETIVPVTADLTIEEKGSVAAGVTSRPSRSLFNTRSAPAERDGGVSSRCRRFENYPARKTGISLR